VVTDERVQESAPAVLGRLPPIAELTVASMILVITGGIYLAAYLPHAAPLAPAIGLLAASALLLAGNVVTLSRLRDFAWDRFFLVGRWTLLAYAIIAGMLELVFVLDGTRGSMLIVITLSLLVYAVDIPMLLAFSVARYVGSGGAGRLRKFDQES
jgi:hypothetical protein